MTVVTIPNVVPVRIPAMRHARNGRVPDPALVSGISDSINNAIRYRGKEVFRAHGVPRSTIATGTRTRWRFFYHSSPVVRDLAVYYMLAAPGVTGSYGSVTIAGGAYNQTIKMQSGAFADKGALGVVPDDLTEGIVYFRNVPADTDMSCFFADTNSRLFAVDVWEVGPFVEDTTSGYLQSGYVTNAPILDAQRAGIVAKSNDMMRRGCAHLANFAVQQPSVAVATSSAALVNVVDNSSTANTVNSPGYFLDLRNHSGNSSYITLAHYGTSAGVGAFSLVKPGGSVAATIAIGAALQWRTVNFQIVGNAITKYDFMQSSVAGVVTETHSVCIYKHNP